MRRFWMSRADRRAWKSAKTVADLGELMAQWLEGTLASWPGYQPNYGPDEETLHLVPTLVALNRAGFLTVGSQPGERGTGADGMWWEQKAAVEGFVTDRALYYRLLDAARVFRMEVTVHDPATNTREEQIIVTTRDGEPYTGFGGTLDVDDLITMWPVIGKDAFGDVASAVFLTIAAPEFGTAGECLWVLLDYLIGQRREEDDDPWASGKPVVLLQDEAAAIFDQARNSTPES
ncbi:DUF6919 domain-containing protein (plasmid) [Streptomyces sp. BR1]|uniref:DUF6919 domain-containing protein n=1 Tax=Streptomyces sp. BR1 TaxID=1592323 RepID=UPI00402B9506